MAVGALMRRALVVVVSVGLVAVLALWLSYSADPPQSPEPELNFVAKRACEFSSQYRLHIDCYWVSLKDDGVEATLSAAIFRAGPDAASDPLVYVAGGPGESGNTTAESLEIWDEWLSRQALGRDFVLLDLRGLAPSVPAWDCQEYSDISRDLLQRNLTFAQEAEIVMPVAEQCLDAWQQALTEQGGPVRQIRDLHSRRYADDLHRALHHLGYQQWNYLAVSYGTRVALLSATLHQEVRRIILDSPYPFDAGSLSDGMIIWAEAFAEYWRDCTAAGCAFDEEKFWQLMVELRTEPRWVEVEDWRTNRKVRWLLNDGRLAAAIYTAFYSSVLRSEIADALAEFARGDHAKLQYLLEVFYNQVFDSRFNSSVYWAVECNDNPLDPKASFDAVLQQVGRWQPYFLVDWEYNICRSSHFHNGQLPAMRKLQIPVLNAVGSLDPITTKKHAQALMPWLAQGYLAELADTSHAEFFGGDCGQRLIGWFLNAAEDELRAQWSEQLSQCRLSKQGD